MTATDEQPPELVQRLAAAIDRTVWSRLGPVNAAVRVMAEPEIRDGLAATVALRRVAQLHTPRMWADGETKVCRHCEKAFPCPTAEILGLT